MALLETLSAGSQILGGLSGLFGKKKSKTQSLSESVTNQQLAAQRELLPMQTALQKSAMLKAQGYDGAAEYAALRDALEKTAARTIDIGQRSALAQAMRNGMSSGDTAGLAIRQRNLDSAMNPLMLELARLKSDMPFKEMQMKQMGLGMGASGGPANAITMSAMSQPKQDNSPYYNAISGGVQAILDAERKRKALKVGTGIAKIL